MKLYLGLFSTDGEVHYKGYKRVCVPWADLVCVGATITNRKAINFPKVKEWSGTKPATHFSLSGYPDGDALVFTATKPFAIEVDNEPVFGPGDLKINFGTPQQFETQNPVGRIPSTTMKTPRATGKLTPTKQDGP